MSEPSQAVIHFYRAAVGHADVWRQRLDTTTNWAVITNAGLITFVFSSPQAFHFVLLLSFVLNVFFLLIESRRYQMYDIWRDRLQVLHHYVFADVFFGDEPGYAISEDERREALVELGQDLGQNIPRLTLLDAVGFRIRRNYGYVFAVTLGAWMLKLWVHPEHAGSIDEFVGRAHVGLIDGEIVLALVLTSAILSVYMALRAPSERIVAWKKEPSPLRRLMELGPGHRPPWKGSKGRGDEQTEAPEP